MNSCMICQGSQVELFLDLGSTTLANRFVKPDEIDETEPTFSLRVGFCCTCSHVQLMDRVPPVAMFKDYLYVSGISETLRNHLHDLSNLIVRRHNLHNTDLVVDIGCNDGTLLQKFHQNGVRTLGVDPAENLASPCADSKIPRYVGFFDSRTAAKIASKWGKAKVVTSTNSFPHIHDLHDFMQGIDIVLDSDGVFIIEAHYLGDLLEQVAFDTIYHEHVSYWALRPLIALLDRHGFVVTNAERLPLHHGQLRISVQRRSEAKVSPVVEELVAHEVLSGMSHLNTYVSFAKRTLALKSDLLSTLRRLKAQGNRIVGYGAPAKGNTLLSYLGVDSQMLDYIADRSPLKQGRLTPGTHIPVVSPSQLLADQPDYVLLLSWNFAEEIIAQQAEYQRRGGKFILPVPAVRVISSPPNVLNAKAS